MIGTLDIELSAHDPQRPIRAISAHVGSPTSVRIRNVPRRVGEWRITSVRVSATYPDGTTVEADAVPTGGVYVATVEGCETAGTSRNGFAVKADGIDENGATVHDYTLGRGDVFILSDDGRQLPQTPLTAVNILPSRPTVPHVGDAVWADGGALEIWDGHAWRSPAPGGGSVDSVNGQTGTVVLTGEDIQTSGDDEETLSDKVVTLGTELGSHTADVDNPHSVSARQVGAYTSEEVDDRLELKQDALTDDQKAVLDGGPYLPATPSEQVEGSFDVPPGTLQNISASSGDFGDSLSKGGKEVATEDQLRVTMTLVGSDQSYRVQLDGDDLTFERIKSIAQTRNAVIQRGQVTYSVTYIGATEMMWDVTGTVQGDVLTGQIHIFDQSGVTVVQRVEPKTLATKTMIDEIKDTVNTDNRILVNDATAAIQARESEESEWTNEIRFDKGYEPLSGSEMAKLDKSVQTITMGVGASSLDIVLPDAVDGTVRELVVYVKAADSDCALNFPAGTYYGDNPNGAKAVAGGVTAVYLTEMGEGGWMLRIVELEQHTVGATA